MSPIFVVYAVCVNKSFMRSFLRIIFLIATILRCFVVAKCLAVAATAAVAMMSEEGDKAARAPPRAESVNIRARIGQRLRLTSKSVACFDASAAFEPKLLPRKSIFSHMIAFFRVKSEKPLNRSFSYFSLTPVKIHF